MVSDTREPQTGEKIVKAKTEILKSLMPNQELIELDNDDVLLVKRTTKGNLLPAFSQTLTVAEAKTLGAWDSCRGTMDFWISLHPDHYEDALTVQNHNGFVFAIRSTGDWTK